MTPLLRTAAPLLLAAALAACGSGGADTGAAGITDTSTAQGGSAAAGAAVLVLPLPGPELQLEQPATLHVQLDGAAQVGAHYPAAGTVTLALAEPATGDSTVGADLGPQAPAAVPLQYAAHVRLPAGTHRLAARVTVRTYTAAGQPTGALAVTQADVRWRVEVQP